MNVFLAKLDQARTATIWRVQWQFSWSRHDYWHTTSHFNDNYARAMTPTRWRYSWGSYALPEGGWSHTWRPSRSKWNINYLYNQIQQICRLFFLLAQYMSIDCCMIKIKGCNNSRTTYQKTQGNGVSRFCCLLGRYWHPLQLYTWAAWCW